MRSPPALPRLLAIASLALATLVAGCDSQGEGERCDLFATNSGTSDCKSGLVCKNVPAVVGAHPEAHSGVCCPSDPSQATTSACMNNGGLIDADTSPPDASATGDETTAAEASPE